MKSHVFTLMDGESLAYPVSEFERTNIAKFTKPRLNHVKFDDNATWIEANGAEIYHKLRLSIFNAAREDPVMQQTLQAQKFDRPRYEARAAEIIAEYVDQVPLMHDYRTAGKYYEFRGKIYSADVDAAKDIPDAKPEEKLNVSSVEEQDLTKIALRDEFDCDKMSAIKGLLQHEMDLTFLHENDPDPSKRPHEYYLAAGLSSTTYHAYIISSATGNVIEATADIHPYVKRDDPNYKLKDFIAGAPFRGHYTRSDGTKASDVEYTLTTGDFDQTIYFRRRAAIMAGNYDALDQHVTSRKVPQSDTLKAFDQQIFISSSCDAKDVTVALTPIGHYLEACLESEFKRE